MTFEVPPYLHLSSPTVECTRAPAAHVFTVIHKYISFQSLWPVDQSDVLKTRQQCVEIHFVRASKFGERWSATAPGYITIMLNVSSDDIEITGGIDPAGPSALLGF